MKLLVVGLLAIAAIAESRRCEPGSVFKEYCNSCHCSADGEYAMCTMMACDPNVWNKDGTRKIEDTEETESDESKKICEPGTSFRDYCNSCTCSPDGKHKACTLMACDPSVWNKDGSRKIEFSEETESEESKKICEPGTSFRDYCNSCRCSPDGKHKACTLMACDPRVWNKDGTKKLEPKFESVDESESEESEKHCEPNSIYKDYCNTCHCSADGKDAACTAMACDPSVWNKDGTLKVEIDDEPESEEDYFNCEPYSTFKDYCNTCKCSDDGKDAVCTLMACDPNVWNKDGSRKMATRSVVASEESAEVEKVQKCKPGKVYSPDGCNTCICSEDGTDSACTLKLCISNLIRTHSDKDVKKWGPRYNQGDSCTPRESFYSECNQCICSRDGKSAFCTLMMC